MTRVLVVGNGGREHAMGRALATATPAPELIFAPGNPGTADLGENAPVKADNIDALVALARERAVDLVVPGPELPLVLGLADALAEVGIPCAGPGAGAAQLEGSKAFCRQVADQAGVPGPFFRVVTTVEEAAEAIERWPDQGLPVVKADGLAGGKGVYLPDSREDCLQVATELIQGSLGPAGRTVVLEERLAGIEASLFYACDGTRAVALPHAQDHKRALDGDQGPNTGGMGAVSPNPVLTDDLLQEVEATFITPTLRTLADQGTPFVGFLFAGLMLTPEGPKLLEYNVRLGDPETQAILPRLADGDLLGLCRGIAAGDLTTHEPRAFRPEATCAVVVSAAGYPDPPRKGDPITVDPALETPDRWLIHAGTARIGESLVTSGGRVAAVVARSTDAPAARVAAYQGINLITFDGKHYRTDIGSSDP